MEKKNNKLTSQKLQLDELETISGGKTQTNYGEPKGGRTQVNGGDVCNSFLLKSQPPRGSSKCCMNCLYAHVVVGDNGWCSHCIYPSQEPDYKNYIGSCITEKD